MCVWIFKVFLFLEKMASNYSKVPVDFSGLNFYQKKSLLTKIIMKMSGCWKEKRVNFLVMTFLQDTDYEYVCGKLTGLKTPLEVYKIAVGVWRNNPADK